MDQTPTSLTGLLGAIFQQASSAPISVQTTEDQSASTSTSQAAADPNASLLGLVRRARSRVSSLSLISDNDTLEDLPTSSLRVVLLDSVYAQVLGRSHTPPGDFTARTNVLRQSQEAYLEFMARLIALQILDARSSSKYVKSLYKQAQDALAQKRAPFPDDASGRRAAKIAAMKLERALVSTLDQYRRSARAKAQTARRSIRSTFAVQATSSTSEQDQGSTEVQYDLLILPKQSAGAGQDSDEEEDERDSDATMVHNASNTDENGIVAPHSLRSYLVMLCHLHALQALSSLDGIYTELQLLASMPRDHSLHSRQRAAREEAEAERRNGQDENEDWRIEQRWGASNGGALLDNKGKPMRPFTIMPGQSSRGAPMGSSLGLGTAQAQMDQRQRLQQQVFQQSHRLPTMTIDEYLAEEERRGNFIQGGGQASAEAPTTKEMLALRSEGGNGVSTAEAEEADEDQRRKAMEWDEFAEANPKGMGNTMNRG